jgi:hypothetical protein
MLTAGVADRMGLQWKLRPATVHSSSDVDSIRVPIVMDADDTVMTAVSMVGAVAIGARVYIMRVPPAGNYIVGYLGTNLSRPGDLMATPIETSSDGTPTAGGTTEIIDSVLGEYTFEAQEGVRYKLYLNPIALNQSVAGDRYAISLHYTIDDTAVGIGDLLAGGIYIANQGAGNNGADSHVLITSIMPGAATVRVAASTQRINGTGIATPKYFRQIWAEAMGNI